MNLKFFLRAFVLIFSFGIFATLVGAFSSRVEAQVEVHSIQVSLDNGGDADATVYIDVKDRDNNFLITDDPVAVSGRGGTDKFYTLIGDLDPFTVVLDPVKGFDPDPRDVDCRDPVFKPTSLGGVNGVAAWYVDFNFECWIPPPAQPPPPPPPPPPPVYNPPSNLSRAPACFGPALVVTFSWTLGTNTDIWLDVDTNNFTDGSWWNRNLPGATSFAWSAANRLSLNTPPFNNTTYYWRLWDGQNYTNGASFTTPTCYLPPRNLRVTPGCFGAAPFVRFNWSLGTHTDIWLDVDNNNFSDGTWWNKHLPGENTFLWHANSTLSNNVAPVENATYYWRLWDGIAYTNGASFTTPDCYVPPTNLSKTPGCFGEAPVVTFTWLPGSRNNVDMWIEVSIDNFLTGFWNKNVTGQTSFTWSAANRLSLNTAPLNGTEYWWRLWDGQQRTLPSPRNVLIPQCYQPPSDLSVGFSCLADGSPQFTFSWAFGSRTTPLFLDVSEDNWASFHNRSRADRNTFVWNGLPGHKLNTGLTPDDYAPAFDKTYKWRLWDGWDHLAGSHNHYPPTGTTTVAIGTFSASFCYDLAIESFTLDRTSYNTSEIATGTVVIKNLRGSGTPPGAPLIRVGLWERSRPPLPDCGADPPVASLSWHQSLETPGPIAVGESRSMPFSFNVGAVQGTFTASAYMEPGCIGIGLELDWTNNGPRSKTYRVVSPAWFETIGGDVGTPGDITVSRAPAAGRCQSDYLKASATKGITVCSLGWVLTGYQKPLIPAGPAPPPGAVYNYLAQSFRQKAMANERPDSNPGPCQIGLTDINGLAYCRFNAEYAGGLGPIGNTVWFIDGNLTIKDSLTIGSTRIQVLVVRGNITINSNVNRVDAVLIAGGTLNDTSDGLPAPTQQLQINGAVYGQDVNLLRSLRPTTCGVSPCDNAFHPAEIIKFDPKYIMLLNSILGTPALSWKEVAP